MKLSQTKKVLQALERGEVLTPMDAIERWKITRLGAIIFDLKKLGYDIDNLEGGTSSKYARYRMRGKITLPPAFEPHTAKLI